MCLALPASIHFARAVGGALLGLAIMTWFARNSGPSQARNAMVAGLTLFFLRKVVEYVRAILVSSLQSSGWTFAGLWFILFLFTVIAGRSAMSES